MLQYVSRGATLFFQSFVKSRFISFSVFFLFVFFVVVFSSVPPPSPPATERSGEAAQSVAAAGVAARRWSYTMSVML